MSFSTIDEFKRQVILALFADNQLFQRLVLKGGNLLDIVYGISTRPSRDIDLSMGDEFADLNVARQLIEVALTRWFEPKGYVIFDVHLVEKPENLTDEFRAFWGGYKVDFKIIDRETHDQAEGNIETLRRRALEVAEDQGRKFPIEISKHEYVEEKTEELVDDLTVNVYSPQMFVAEKLRAICQQMPAYARFVKKHATPRGRDFLDIHNVGERFSIDFDSPAFQWTARKVFAAKRVDVHLIARIGEAETRAFHRPDYISIAPTIRPGFELQPYDFYVDYVVAKCRLLEALWNP